MYLKILPNLWQVHQMASGCLRDIQNTTVVGSVAKLSSRKICQMPDSMAETSILSRCPAIYGSVYHYFHMCDGLENIDRDLCFEDEGTDVDEDPEVERANEVWNEYYDDTDSEAKLGERRIVNFCTELVCIISFEDDEDSRAARKGSWETLATDRQRFMDRISNLEKIISPILANEHREKVYKRLQKSAEHDPDCSRPTSAKSS
ncbi:hypothetical protein HDE_00109 [Halotydeus destructor]|nr:hypothetical protein HDE_00109 [Halotydeus destructor]